uniref:Fibronectin type-III domain-containing protein n=1 Tax=Otus sunia TaxID=257818 RepID=A0A8C8E9N8_9STRI
TARLVCPQSWSLPVSVCSRGLSAEDRIAGPPSAITLSCQLKPLRYTEQCKIAIFFNSSELISNYGSSVSTGFLVRTYGKHMFTCKIVCEYKRRLICGIDIESGNPPDEPKNVSCIQYGTDGHPTCTWDKGRLTHINTTYVIHLNKKSALSCSNLSEKPSVQSKPVTLFPPVLSCAAYLSAIIFFLFLLLVKPHPPNFLVEFENSSATNCTFFWHSEAQAQRWRLRYRPLTRLNSEKCSLYGLEPHTAYEFQVSCKIHPERGLWSNWRTYQTRTPEAGNTRWHLLHQKKKRVINALSSQALSRSEARGRILRYTVTFKALGTRSPPAGEAHVTTQTSLARVMPRVGYKITVTAENSRGRSPPASIVTDLGTQDLPPPQKVSAVAMGNSSIFVSWKAPVASAASVSGYVVEWADTPRSPRPEPCPAWVKLPASNLSTVIAGTILLQKLSEEQMYTTPWANGILVSWEAIPAPQQRGCITGYRIYLQKNDGQAAPEVYSSAPRSLHIAELQPGQPYTLWMTASTAAGEGPWGNTQLLCLERKVCKAIPDPANATWAKNYLSMKETLVKTEPPALQDKLLFGSGGNSDWPPARGPGQEEPGYRALPSPADGELYEQHLPDLYKRIVLEEHTQTVSEYITNPVTDTAAVCLPPATGATDPLPELDCNPLAVFPTTFLTPILSCEGNLTLDTVKINCSSFTM